MAPALRPKASCDLLHGAGSECCGQLWLPSAGGNRGAARGPGSTVEKCASSRFSITCATQAHSGGIRRKPTGRAYSKPVLYASLEAKSIHARRNYCNISRLFEDRWQNVPLKCFKTRLFDAKPVTVDQGRVSGLLLRPWIAHLQYLTTKPKPDEERDYLDGHEYR